MTGDEFKQWREARLLTTAEAGRLLGYGIRQVQRLESRGPRTIRRCVALACAAIDRNLPPAGSEATGAPSNVNNRKKSKHVPRRKA